MACGIRSTRTPHKKTLMNKRRYPLLLFLFVTHVAVAQNQWAWMTGEKSANINGIYGTRGVAHLSNSPGSRIGASYWTDKQGNFWLFGGRGNGENSDNGPLNDLWRYNPSSDQWTWIGGAKDINNPGSYGRKGSPSGTNQPGARSNAVSWTDSRGNFWLFGGSGVAFTQRREEDEDDEEDGELKEGLLNDLWVYSPSSNQWTWISGRNRINQKGKYGRRNDPSGSNVPGSRSMATGWKDAFDNLWLFGGNGYSSKSEVSNLNDVWKYSPITNEWSWMKGDRSEDAGDHYGQKGVFANSNTPGGRRGSTGWMDKQGKFWLYGGVARSDLYSDLWKYDPLTNQWAWISGSEATNVEPQYKEKGVPDAEANPGSRTLASGWADTDGNLWLFGGNGYDRRSGANPLNNLWKYSIATNEWTFVKGESSINPTAVYGTQDVVAIGNQPGGMSNSAGWKDQEGNLWIFGGQSADGNLNQTWKFSFICGDDISGTIAPANASICDGGSQVLTATGGTSYEWRRDNVIITGQTISTITANQPGTYSVIIKNGGCSAPASNTAVITLATAPSGSISPASSTICEGGSQVLTATGGTTYVWRRDGVTIEGQTAATLAVTIPGTYSVTIKNGSCSGEASNTSVVTVGSTAGSRYEDVKVTANVPTRLSARAIGISYEWSPVTGLDNPSSATPMVTINTAIQYLVRITPAQGCQVIDTVRVKVGTENKVFVPTAFTPNGNNVNDRLRPLSNLISIDYFRVYNRWGNLMFETKEVGAGWDGRYKGVSQPSDTYTWVLSGKTTNGEPVKQSGKTLLIR
jgi:gliding motility-associated-like protein